MTDGVVTAVAVEWIGSLAINITYRDSSGKLGSELLYRDREPMLAVAAMGQPWSFDGDGALFRLISEAHRIRLAYLFDPLLAVHTSLVEPLPHQITAVYGDMLPRQPLRFLLADDPGAGQTIMTGLFVKELWSAATCSAASSTAPATWPSNGKTSSTAGFICLANGHPLAIAEPVSSNVLKNVWIASCTCRSGSNTTRSSLL